VASGTITHRQAIVIALFAELIGALALGSSVTETIKSRVIDIRRFEHDPYTLMLAMACTSMGSAVWVLAATRLRMPVSTTHATVGAIMGVGIAAFGYATCVRVQRPGR
jgi:sodium-dependent phosphate transporter